MPATIPEPQAAVKSGVMLRADTLQVTFRQKFVPSETNFLFLDYGEYLPAGSRSSQLAVPRRESPLFMGKQSVRVERGGKTYELEPYDALHVPLGSESIECRK